MKGNQVTKDDVKRYFLLANAGKRLFDFNRKKSRRLEEGYEHIFDEIFNLETRELNERITDKVRLGRYDNFSWCKGEQSLNEIGPWPKMKSLDARLTTGNIIDTAEAIEGVRNGKIILSYDDIDEKKKREDALGDFSSKSKSIRDNLDFIYERFPIILFPGGEIREKDYNTWARENDAPLCEIYRFDLDDGNSRAVNYALEGLDKSPCFYGFYKNNFNGKKWPRRDSNPRHLD